MDRFLTHTIQFLNGKQIGFKYIMVFMLNKAKGTHSLRTIIGLYSSLKQIYLSLRVGFE